MKLAKKKAMDPKSSSDGMFLIMILAAIFVPFIGVYIKNSWRTNNWFWITLVLCILSIFGFGFINPLFFGLWGIAVIIALLNVFDVI